jgi:hypothetical protein
MEDRFVVFCDKVVIIESVELLNNRPLDKVLFARRLLVRFIDTSPLPKHFRRCF